MNGSFPVDITHVRDLTPEILEYFNNRGATVGKSFNGPVIQFPGCKPSAANRLFFPDEDSILLFSLVFGNVITGSRVKQINDLLEQQRLSQ